MELLPTVWFVAIAILWAGYLLLEGFDLGVGMHMLITARSEGQRRLMLNTIGPVWDGNEVWLITAAAATFAAFPLWYASLFSALYLPMVAVLLGLILRAVAIEYRGKGRGPAWRRGWDLALGLGSFTAAFGVGAALALTTTGLPINANGDRVGGAFAWLGWPAVLGGVAVVGFCLLHAAAFLALKTDGPVRMACARFVTRGLPAALAPLVAWAVLIQLQRGNAATWTVTGIAVAAAVWAWFNARAGREGRAFAGLAVFLVAGVAAIFGSVYPVVLPSTLNPAWDLTISNAASGTYTLTVMSVVAGLGLPLVLLYQGWTYWVFRRRLSEAQLPEGHAPAPLFAPR